MRTAGQRRPMVECGSACRCAAAAHPLSQTDDLKEGRSLQPETGVERVAVTPAVLT